jgi:hypothetical protein
MGGVRIGVAAPSISSGRATRLATHFTEMARENKPSAGPVFQASDPTSCIPTQAPKYCAFIHLGRSVGYLR